MLFRSLLTAAILAPVLGMQAPTTVSGLVSPDPTAVSKDTLQVTIGADGMMNLQQADVSLLQLQMHDAKMDRSSSNLSDVSASGMHRCGVDVAGVTLNVVEHWLEQPEFCWRHIVPPKCSQYYKFPCPAKCASGFRKTCYQNVCPRNFAYETLPYRKCYQPCGGSTPVNCGPLACASHSGKCAGTIVELALEVVGAVTATVSLIFPAAGPARALTQGIRNLNNIRKAAKAGVKLLKGKLKKLSNEVGTKNKLFEKVRQEMQSKGCEVAQSTFDASLEGVVKAAAGHPDDDAFSSLSRFDPTGFSDAIASKGGLGENSQVWLSALGLDDPTGWLSVASAFRANGQCTLTDESGWHDFKQKPEWSGECAYQNCAAPPRRRRAPCPAETPYWKCGKCRASNNRCQAGR